MVFRNLPAIKPPALKPGDRVGLACPASRPASPAVVRQSVKVVEEIGLNAVVGKHVLNVHGYMAGTDDERLADLNSFLADDSIAAIFCITGGFGTIHLLDQLDYTSIAEHPKIIVGCDDITSLLLAVHGSSGLITLHGPTLDQVRSRYTFDRLKTAVTSRDPLPAISVEDCGDERFVPAVAYAPIGGRVEGLALGGNLTAVVSLMGTPFQPDFDQRILFLEDVNERHDILDRWLTTLYISGHLARTSGVAFGDFAGCGTKSSYTTLSLEDLFGARVKMLSKPTCFGLPLGQSDRAATIPIGINTVFDADKGRLEFTESALA